ncbi:protein maestro-like [Tiliqua scincoides]|uniref:protein maestro-like n=1 Tax=Tiliqua scincoides TaxID=71010 RepID=UPI0034634918
MPHSQSSFLPQLTGHPLLHKPELRGLLLQRLLAAAHASNATLRTLAVRGLGTVAEGAPQEVKKQRRALLAALLQAAGDAANPEVVCESLRALRKVCGHLGRPRDLRAVAGQARAYLRHADDAVRTAAFELFGQLAKATPHKQGKAWTREALAPLLLHLRDPSPTVAEACLAAFLACAPFLGLQDLVNDVSVALCKEVSGAQHSGLLGRVCHQLVHTDPALLEALTVEMPSYLHCAWDGIRLAACKLSGALLEMVGAPCLGQQDPLDPLLQSLHSLCGSPCTAVKMAATEALQLAQQRGKETLGSLATGHQGRSLLPGWFFIWRHQGSPRPA